jgi:hypothetical protein
MMCLYKGIKANIETAVSQPAGIILTNDLKTLLFTAKTDEELDLVLKAIQKYETQSAVLGKLKFNFEAPLMLLFYVSNKTNKALELFMSNVVALTH